MADDITVVMRLQKGCNRLGLVESVLKDDIAVLFQIFLGELRDDANGIEAVETAVQCLARLKAHIALRQVRIVVPYVGRVAHEHVEGLALECIEPVSLAQRDVPDLQVMQVLIRDFQC